MGKIIDISKWQGSNINWDTLAKEVDFLILRASSGTAEDSLYRSYVEECKSRGIPFGVYHYLKCDTEELAISAAYHMYEIANADNPLFYVADVESSEIIAVNYDEVTYAYLQTLRSLGVSKLGLYISQARYPKCTLCHSIIDFSWIPRYGKNNGTYDPKYQPTCPYDLHQYTDAGKVNGIPGNVDLNRLSGTKPFWWFVEEPTVLSEDDYSNIDEDYIVDNSKGGLFMKITEIIDKIKGVNTEREEGDKPKEIVLVRQPDGSYKEE